MARSAPISKARQARTALARLQVLDPGRPACPHQWRIDEITVEQRRLERWICTACGRTSWRDPLAEQLIPWDRASRWSTEAAADRWELDLAGEQLRDGQQPQR